MISRNFLASVAIVLASVSPVLAQDIKFSSQNSYPESVTFSAKQDVFLLGSVRQGLVAKLDHAGKYTPFIADNRLISTAGLLVDDARNTLWVTNSDPGVGERTATATQIEPVKLPEALPGADGIHLVDGEHLIVAQNLGKDRIVELTSTDGWKSATIVRTKQSEASMPTAPITVGRDIYVLDSRLDTLFDPKATKVGDYLLQQF